MPFFSYVISYGFWSHISLWLLLPLWPFFSVSVAVPSSAVSMPSCDDISSHGLILYAKQLIPISTHLTIAPWSLVLLDLQLSIRSPRIDGGMSNKAHYPSSQNQPFSKLPHFLNSTRAPPSLVTMLAISPVAGSWTTALAGKAAWPWEWASLTISPSTWGQLRERQVSTWNPFRGSIKYTISPPIVVVSFHKMS